MSTLVDSFFWGRWTWPEMEAILFNVVEGKSEEWGVSDSLVGGAAGRWMTRLMGIRGLCYRSLPGIPTSWSICQRSRCSVCHLRSMPWDRALRKA